MRVWTLTFNIVRRCQCRKHCRSDDSRLAGMNVTRLSYPTISTTVEMPVTVGVLESSHLVTASVIQYPRNAFLLVESLLSSLTVPKSLDCGCNLTIHSFQCLLYHSCGVQQCQEDHVMLHLQHSRTMLCSALLRYVPEGIATRQ